MVDHVDYERYTATYKIVVKKHFTDQNDISLLDQPILFSNLRETESGIVIAKTNIINSSNNTKESITDGYEPEFELRKVRKLIRNALNEYNKEQQKIKLPLYESLIHMICRLCHTLPSLGGNSCIMAKGGLPTSLIQLVASLTGYNIVNFKISKLIYSKDVLHQLKHRLVQSYYRAGIRV